ncbi:uncharacterized protein LY89DRAFT_786514 [Mollisia scopiformis]|uniref:Uncharacterized protein n=1 Tax=Mollisia scopiformis TaxID=149040 RepID=A0A194WVC8_MOLSC|nr:uncharacterized protein LY89DRAFT_786514 [Mollisia scopiformis]KUJ11624.1 hypothetical protein LY89DRAFT_786514 [Mollisia scopiformis]
METQDREEQAIKDRMADIQPKHFTQKQIIMSFGYANIHTFMRAHRLKFSDFQHYEQAQTMIEQQRYNLQSKWEQDRDMEELTMETVTGLPTDSQSPLMVTTREHNKNIRDQMSLEQELMELGVMMGGSSLQAVRLEKEDVLFRYVDKERERASRKARGLKKSSSRQKEDIEWTVRPTLKADGPTSRGRSREPKTIQREASTYVSFADLIDDA